MVVVDDVVNGLVAMYDNVVNCLVAVVNDVVNGLVAVVDDVVNGLVIMGAFASCRVFDAPFMLLMSVPSI